MSPTRELWRGLAPIDRFWKYVDKFGEYGCWEWTAVKVGAGYGRFTFENRQVLAHRWSYEYFVRPIPQGLTIDHLCRNPRCVNPSHLEAVTQLENIRRRPRSNLCKNGHQRPLGSRCMACHKEERMARAERNAGQEPPVHGVNGYRAYRCRCDVCRDAHSSWSRARYALRCAEAFDDYVERVNA